MTHTSLYRKWRPQTFKDVTGQTHVIQTLANALSQGRVSHAYLFSGPRGTGKTTVARLLAKSLNCARGMSAEACNECENCRRITQGTSMDVLEIDGASNRGIDEIREVRESIRFSPAEGRYRVYIIDEIHMLTAEAFNALLKVLEEPPAHGVFIFATTEPHKVPATVLSRCQRFDFRPLFSTEVRERLATVCQGEGVAYEEAALDAIARHADGALRDALSILDQCIAFEGDRLTAAGVEQVIGTAPRQWFHRLIEMMRSGDAAEGFRLVQDLRLQGKDLRQFVRDASRHVRDLLVIASTPDGSELVEGPADERETMRRQAEALGVERLLAALNELLRVDGDMRWAPNPQLLLETTLVTLAYGNRSAGEAGPGGAARAPAGTAAGKTAAGSAPAAGPAKPSAATQGAVTPRAVAEGTSGTREADTPPWLDPPSRQPADATRSADPRPPAGEAASSPRPGAAATWAGPRPAAAAPSGDLEAVWSRMLARLREERHPKLVAFLIEGTPVAVGADGALTVAFPPDRRFHRDGFERDPQRGYVEKVLGELLGKPTTIRTYIAGEDGDGAEAPPAGGGHDDEPSLGAAEEASPGGNAGAPPRGEHNAPDDYPPAVQQALRVFGGRVTATERAEDAG